MEIRKAKLIANTRKSGGGGTTFKSTLPTKWVREMGLGENDRELLIKFDGESIIITKEEKICQ